MYSYDDSRRGGTAPASNALGLGSTAPSRRSHEGNPGGSSGGLDIITTESELEDRISRISVSVNVDRGDIGVTSSSSGASVSRNLTVPTPRRPVTRQIGLNNSTEVVDDLNRALKHDRFRAAASSYTDDLDDEDIREQQFVKKSGWMSSGAASPVSRKKGVDNADNLEVNIRVGYPSLYCAH